MDWDKIGLRLKLANAKPSKYRKGQHAEETRKKNKWDHLTFRDRINTTLVINTIEELGVEDLSSLHLLLEIDESIIKEAINDEIIKFSEKQGIWRVTQFGNKLRAFCQRKNDDIYISSLHLHIANEAIPEPTSFESISDRQKRETYHLCLRTSPQHSICGKMMFKPLPHLPASKWGTKKAIWCGIFSYLYMGD